MSMVRTQLVDSLRRLRAAGPEQYQEFTDAFRAVWSEHMQYLVEASPTDVQNRQGQVQAFQLILRSITQATQDPQRK